MYDGERINCGLPPDYAGSQRVEDYAEGIEEGLDDGDQYFYVDANLEQDGGVRCVGGSRNTLGDTAS